LYVVENSRFFNNDAETNYGGAIYTASGGTIRGSEFEGNTVSGSGGAVYSSGGTTIYDSVFKDNLASSSGGAIYNSGTTNIIAENGNVEFSGNKSGVTINRDSNGNVTSTSGGTLNDVYNSGSLYLKAKKGVTEPEEEGGEGEEYTRSITFGGSIENGSVYVGDSDYMGDVNLNKVKNASVYVNGGNANIINVGSLDESGNPVKDKKGKTQADSDKRDFENVPLDQDIDKYFEREVLPYNKDAWIDKSKTKIGYEIPFTRTFYEYKQLEKADDIAARIERNVAQWLQQNANK
jgi:predicted outer membrane repeat protein